MMRFHLDPGSKVPIYRQLTEQIERSLVAGEFSPGDRLPSVRELAMNLRINPNTVGRAYSELERQGVVTRQQGRGVFVSSRQKDLSKEERRAVLRQPIEELLIAAWKAEIDVDEVIAELQQRADEFAMTESSRTEERDDATDR
ncbi:MAG: GntR family transcriptional regulator [Deltaproteobacteria bacterium]|nr:GntR family transcriptional regulator [Deltaproteobacteria bacterium]